MEEDGSGVLPLNRSKVTVIQDELIVDVCCTTYACYMPIVNNMVLCTYKLKCRSPVKCLTNNNKAKKKKNIKQRKLWR